VIGLGGAGLISVASNETPREMSRLVAAAIDGDWATARSAKPAVLSADHGKFWESSPGPVKCVMAMMGRLKEPIACPSCR